MNIVPVNKVFILPHHTGILQTHQAYTTSSVKSCIIAWQSRIIITGLGASLWVISGEEYYTCNQGIHYSSSRRYFADPPSLPNFLCSELYYCTAKHDHNDGIAASIGLCQEMNIVPAIKVFILPNHTGI